MIGRLLIAASTLTTIAAAPAERPALGPSEAIAASDAARDRGLSRTVKLQVRSAAKTHDGVFLNSEADYRDPKNLSVHLSSAVAEHLAQNIRRQPQDYLVGKTIAVRGYLVRVPVGRSGKTYAHRVLVRRSDDILVQ